MPTTLAALAEHYATGEAVDIEKVAAADDTEEAEYDALQAAAEASEDLLTGPGRRVVLVGEGGAAPDEPIPWSEIVAVHVDTEEIVPGAEDLPELGWYAVQEIPDLLL